MQKQFKQVQSKQTIQKLSERNCVEIIMKLLEIKLIQVIFTSNGREYLTPKQLEREISEEIEQRGRITIHLGNITILQEELISWNYNQF